MTAAPRFEVTAMETVADEWNVLRRYDLDRITADGRRAPCRREVVHRPDTAAVLPYSATRDTVLLVTQTRLAVVLAGESERFFEAPCGIIEARETPYQAALREAYEETGYRLSGAQPIGAFFLNPALSTERAHLFVADLDAATGQRANPDDSDVLGPLETIELPVLEAMTLCRNGGVADAKTALLIGVVAAQLSLGSTRGWRPT